MRPLSTAWARPAIFSEPRIAARGPRIGVRRVRGRCGCRSARLAPRPTVAASYGRRSSVGDRRPHPRSAGATGAWPQSRLRAEAAILLDSGRTVRMPPPDHLELRLALQAHAGQASIRPRCSPGLTRTSLATSDSNFVDHVLRRRPRKTVASRQRREEYRQGGAAGASGVRELPTPPASRSPCPRRN